VLLGVGTGDTQGELNRGWRRIELDQVVPGLNAHNQYLQTYLAIGLVGGAILLLALLIPLVLAMRHGELLYVQFLVLVLLCFLTESYLIRQHGAMFYATVNALLGFGLLLPASKPQVPEVDELSTKS
jgi:O-antigen ligase